MVGKFKYIDPRTNRHANAADALNDDDIMIFADETIGILDPGVVDGAIFNFRRNDTERQG